MLNGESIWRHSGRLKVESAVIIENSPGSVIRLKGSDNPLSYIIGSPDTMPTIMNRGLIEATMFPPSEFFIGDMEIINMGEIRVQGATPSVLHVGYTDHEAEMQNERKITINTGNTLIYHGKSRDVKEGSNILDGGVLKCTAGSQQLYIDARTVSEVFISGGNLNLFDSAGTLSVHVGGGQMIFNDNSVTISTLSITEGDVTIDEVLVVHDLIMSGGRVSGSGHMTIDNSWVWEDGTVEKSNLASIDLNGPLVFRGRSPKQLGRTLNLKANSTWFVAGSSLYIHERLVVDVGVHIKLSGSGMIIRADTSSSSAIFQNKGSVTASLDDGGLNLEVDVENHGDMVLKGDLILSQFTHQSGHLSLESGTLIAHSGEITLNENYFHMGRGSIHVRKKLLPGI